MIVSFSLIRRRPDIPPERFRAHWLDPHGPLTAKIPGTVRYVQNHVLAGPGTNALAQRLSLDGFAELAFATPASRAAAHASPEIAACNLDSRAFIGAVSRVITDDADAAPPPEPAPLKQIVLTLAGDPTPLTGTLQRLETRCVIAHRILEQAGAPNSTVPHHGVEVASLHELWLPSEDAMARNAALLAREAPGAATFQVHPHLFL